MKIITGTLRCISSNFGKILLACSIFAIVTGIWIYYSQAILTPTKNKMLTSEISSQSINNSIYEQIIPGFDREPIRLKQFQGKKMYIKFWATWCPLCLAGLEDFTTLTEQISSSPDIAVISIVSPGFNGEISRDDFIEWAKAQNLSFPIYFDESGALNKEFGIKGYPAAVYLSSDGTVIKKTAGDEQNAQILHNLTSLGSK
ncbi:MAG: TlpA family protein disulfide reductase [Betaproteobacteria bacterium]|nr:TlpA family protein disulfide reductase [Betaproteobacteria bacterium]